MFTPTAIVTAGEENTTQVFTLNHIQMCQLGQNYHLAVGAVANLCDITKGQFQELQVKLKKKEKALTFLQLAESTGGQQIGINAKLRPLKS